METTEEPRNALQPTGALQPAGAPEPAAPPPGVSPPPARRPSRAWVALGIALAADAVQILLLPLFGPGIVSPFDDVLDIVIGLVMVRLLGWHWAFLPSLVAELVPGLDLFPSWTTAVWFVTRSRRTPS